MKSIYVQLHKLLSQINIFQNIRMSLPLENKIATVLQIEETPEKSEFQNYIYRVIQSN